MGRLSWSSEERVLDINQLIHISQVSAIVMEEEFKEAPSLGRTQYIFIDYVKLSHEKIWVITSNWVELANTLFLYAYGNITHSCFHRSTQCVLPIQILLTPLIKSNQASFVF